MQALWLLDPVPVPSTHRGLQIVTNSVSLPPYKLAFIILRSGLVWKYFILQQEENIPSPGTNILQNKVLGNTIRKRLSQLWCGMPVISALNTVTGTVTAWGDGSISRVCAA